MKKIGIVGGGQLGRMLAEAAHRLGFYVVILDPTPDSPAGQVADKEITGSITDPMMLRTLASEVDYLTFEIELADSATLSSIAKEKPVNPSPETLSMIKDKFEQKRFLSEHGIATADFMDAPTRGDVQKAAAQFGFPFVLKAKKDSYDGRGNALVERESDIDAAFSKLAGRALYAEKFVPFSKELAVVAARSAAGDVALFPAVETVHVNHICDTVSMPAAIPPALAEEAESLARSVLEHLSGAGVFAIEMFLADRVLVNEIAPRVHNSGHLTIEACVTSQFEQHIRAITGMPLGDTAMKVPAAVMLNILGNRSGSAEPQGFDVLTEEDGVSVHLYGKKETRPGRKMGHITVTAGSLADANEKVSRIRLRVSI